MQHLHFDESPFDSGNSPAPQGSQDSSNRTNNAGHGASANSANNANASATANAAATDAFASWHAAPEDEHMIRLDGLPSMGFPYGGPEFNYVNIRPLRWGQLELLARAAEQDAVEPVIQAVGQCISQPVNQLTIPDFYYLLYWLRINSYPASPLYMPWRCDEPIADDSEEGFHLCNHENLSPLTKADVQIVDLEELGFTGQLPEGLDWPRVSLLPQLFRISRLQQYESEVEDAQEFLQEITATADSPKDIAQARSDLQKARIKLKALKESLKDPSFPQNINPGLVEVLSWTGTGTLAERNEYMLAQPDLSLFEAARQAADKWVYGVKEGVQVKCKECGASRLFTIAVDVPTFLS